MVSAPRVRIEPLALVLAPRPARPYSERKDGNLTPKIVVANWIHPEVMEVLRPHGNVEVNLEREPWPRDELIRRCQGATALMSFMTEWVDEPFLAACPDLRMIACALKGYDNYDIEACRRRRVCLSIVPDLLTDPTAELTVGLMIALGRRILAADRFLRSGAFHGWKPHFYGTGLAGSLVGILGMGAVGKAVATRLQGFGCRICYHDAKPPTETMDALPSARPMPLGELLAAADYVVVCLPIAPGTVHLITAEALARMKSGALLVNTGRGSVVDEEAVAAALAAGHLGGYAADVFEMEDWARPDRRHDIPPGLLAQADRTILTAHIGSAVDVVRREIAMEAARNIVQFLSGQRPQGALVAA